MSLGDKKKKCLLTHPEWKTEISSNSGVKDLERVAESC